jgi:hypothetical protein
MFQTKVVQKIKTHILRSITVSFFEMRSMYVMAIWRMRVACWISKATNTHSEYVILIACPLQQWLRERTTMLRNTYISRLVRTLAPIVVILCVFVGVCGSLSAVFCAEFNRRSLRVEILENA